MQHSSSNLWASPTIIMRKPGACYEIDATTIDSSSTAISDGSVQNLAYITSWISRRIAQEPWYYNRHRLQSEGFMITSQHIGNNVSYHHRPLDTETHRHWWNVTSPSAISIIQRSDRFPEHQMAIIRDDFHDQSTIESTTVTQGRSVIIAFLVHSSTSQTCLVIKSPTRHHFELLHHILSLRWNSQRIPTRSIQTSYIQRTVNSRSSKEVVHQLPAQRSHYFELQIHSNSNPSGFAIKDTIRH